MADEPTVAGMDLPTLRERLDAEVDAAVDEDVVATIEARVVQEGTVSVGAFAAWHDECDEARQTAAERLAAFESRLAALREELPPEERDLAHVRSEFADYEGRFDAMRADLETAAGYLGEAPRRPETAAELYAGARGLSACGELTHGVEHRLEHFGQELDWFAAWLTEPAARIEGFDEELDAVEGYLGRVERLLAEAAANADDPPAGYEPFDAWAGARHLHLLAAVALEEFRVDVAELEEWLASREGDHDEAFGALTDRLAALQERHEATEERVDAAADAIEGFEAAHAEVADAIEAFEADLEGRSPPIDWSAVNDRLRAQFDALGVPYG